MFKSQPCSPRPPTFRARRIRGGREVVDILREELANQIGRRSRRTWHRVTCGRLALRLLRHIGFVERHQQGRCFIEDGFRSASIRMPNVVPTSYTRPGSKRSSRSPSMDAIGGRCLIRIRVDPGSAVEGAKNSNVAAINGKYSLLRSIAGTVDAVRNAASRTADPDRPLSSQARSHPVHRPQRRVLTACLSSRYVGSGTVSHVRVV
jgi:hypothetical protein